MALIPPSPLHVFSLSLPLPPPSPSPCLQDDKRLFDYNVDERVESFIKVILLQAGNYRTDHIMFTMGSDFNHENSHEWYKNLDKLMKYTMMKVCFQIIDALRLLKYAKKNLNQQRMLSIKIAIS